MRFPAFFWPLSAALSMHATLGGWLLTPMESAPHGAPTVWSISLSPTDTPAHSSRTRELSGAPSVSIAPTPELADQRAAAQPVEQASEAPGATPTATTPLRQDDAEQRVRASKQPSVAIHSDHFYAAAELTRLPGLPGEPLIDLGDVSDEVSGSMALRLFIDETGRVVRHAAEERRGLPAELVDVLTRAFSSYPYVPGQRHEQAVKSQVVLLIGVREGQAFTGATAEPESTGEHVQVDRGAAP